MLPAGILGVRVRGSIEIVAKKIETTEYYSWSRVLIYRSAYRAMIVAFRELKGAFCR